jgi:hypothetical protein
MFASCPTVDYKVATMRSVDSIAISKGEPLAVRLEIEDGNPWYASPNIKVFEQGQPGVELRLR